jgi:hypothetical protein
MSQANFNPNLHSRSEVPATPLTSPQIIQGPDCVAILLPNGLWNEALQEQAQSANIRSDPRAVAELIASERSQPSTNQGDATAARPVLQPDRRDAIPLIYCNRTRHIIALVGFVVSSATILGVQMAAIADLVPGFQPLTVGFRYRQDPTDAQHPTEAQHQARDREESLYFIGALAKSK